MKVLMIIILSLGIGGGGIWYYTTQIAASPVPEAAMQQPQEPAAQPLVSANPIFLELEPFTVSLNQNGFSRVLYIGFTLRFEDENSRKRVEKYLPEARSRILIELSSLNPETIHDKEMPQLIKESVKRVLQPAFVPEVYTQHINDVLFTNFVVQ